MPKIRINAAAFNQDVTKKEVLENGGAIRYHTYTKWITINFKQTPSSVARDLFKKGYTITLAKFYYNYQYAMTLQAVDSKQYVGTQRGRGVTEFNMSEDEWLAFSYFYSNKMDTNYGGYEINDFYIDIYYEEKTAQPADNLSPNATIINPRTPIRFSWNSPVDQRKFELQYNVNSTGWKSIERITTERFYNMPANTITAASGLVEWRVRVMAELGAYSSWSVGSFTLGIVAQEPPRIIKPTGDYVRSGSPVTFEWDFISNTSEEQQAYEIEVTLPNEIKTLTGSNTNFHIENLGITESVVVYWRMRVKNQFDEWSDWTEKVSFQTIGLPPAPQIISIENNNRPLIKWNSREQESYQITVEDIDGNVIYKTGNILGATTREYKVPIVLENGKYLFKLKITNAYGIESEETEYTHIIDPKPIDEPTIDLYKSDFFIEVSSTSLNGEVLRDGKIIGNLKLGKFRDYTGANYKTYSYQIRVFENDIAGISKKVGGVTEFGEINTLATVDDLANYFKISYGLDEPVTKAIDYSVQGTEVQLEGRKYPFVEFSSYSTAGFSLSFFVETLEQVKELKKLVDQRKEFLLRESRGKNIQGVLYGFNAEYHNLGYKISCTMTITGEDYD